MPTITAREERTTLCESGVQIPQARHHCKNLSCVLVAKETTQKHGLGTLTHLNFIYRVLVCNFLKNYLDLYKYQFTLLTV